MVSLPFWKIYCLDFASANISLLELPSFQLILLDDVYSWHWLLCASPMIFSRSSILKDTWKLSSQGNILIVQSNSLFSQSNQSITWLTSLKYLLLRIWGTLTASWNIVGIEALMMSIRRKRKSQNTNRKEHLLMPSSRNHMVEQCRCVKINYKNEAVKTSATPTKCAVYLYATTLTSGAAPSYSGSPNDWNWTQAMTVVPELHIQRRHLSAAAVTVVPEHKQFCDEAIS